MFENYEWNKGVCVPTYKILEIKHWTKLRSFRFGNYGFGDKYTTSGQTVGAMACMR